MIFPFILIVVSLVCYMDQYQKLHAEMKFPEDLHTWCPYTKFCHLAASKQPPLDNITGQALFEPCCRPCSCSDDCGLRRNCCHSRYDRYKLDETLGTVCKALNTKMIADNDDTYYHIIDKCLNKKESCKENIVSIYGSFAPVQSKTNGMIYYNQICASCNNQTAILTFPPLMSCSLVPNEGLMEIIDRLRGQSVDCYVQFLVPNHVDISNHACNPGIIIRHCINNGLEQYREKCNAFNATFTKAVEYQNVYCYLCNKRNPMSVEIWERKNYIKCPVTGKIRVYSKSAISVLLDRESVDIHEQSLLDPVAYKSVCFGEASSRTEKNCRPVKCPEGQIRLEKTCRLFGSMWYFRSIKIYLTLTPIDESNNITVHHLKQVSLDELMSSKKEFISRPELHDWDVDLYYKLQAENDTQLQFVVATLFAYHKMVEPRKFISQIQRALSGIWGIKMNDDFYKLKPDFNMYTTYFEVGNGSKFTPFSSTETDFEFSDAIIHGWSEKTLFKLKMTGYFITKLFLCDRIELFEGEYVQIAPEKIYINRSMKFLGNAEYEKMDGPVKGVRVCLTDVLLQENGSSFIGTYLLLHLIDLYIYISSNRLMQIV